MRIFSAAVLAAMILFPHATLSQGRAAAVGVQPVEMQTLTETVPIFAEITTARDGAVAGRVAGNVQKVHVLAGDRVAQDDLLVELNSDLLAIRVAQAEAQIAEAKAGIATATTRLDRAQIALSRIEGLRGGSSFSEGRFDDAQADTREAQSQLAEAEAREKSAEVQLAEARYQLERSKIVAPFSGVVLEVNTIPGAFLQAGTPVVRLLDIDAVEVRASVPANLVAGLEPQQDISGSTEEGAQLALKVRAVLPLEDRTTRTRAVLLEASDLSAMAGIAVGQSLTVDIPVGSARDVLTVPKDALVQGRNGWSVFVAADNKAEPRTVALGVPIGDRYEVLDGLQEGDLVVVRGNERLRPGQGITPTFVETN